MSASPRGSLGLRGPPSCERPSSSGAHSAALTATPQPLWVPLPVSSGMCFFDQSSFLLVPLLFSLLGHLPPTLVASTLIYPLSGPQTLPSGPTSVPSHQPAPRALPGLSLGSIVPEQGGAWHLIYSLGHQLPSLKVEMMMPTSSVCSKN